MNRKIRQVCVMVVTMIAVVSAGAQAEVIGPGDVGGPTNDSAGDLAVVDLNNAALLTAGDAIDGRDDGRDRQWRHLRQ